MFSHSMSGSGIIGSDELCALLTNNCKKGVVHILSGNSGVGKTTIVRHVLETSNIPFVSFDSRTKKSIKYITEHSTDFIKHDNGDKRALVFDEFEFFVDECVGVKSIVDLVRTLGALTFIITSQASIIKVAKHFGVLKPMYHTMPVLPSNETLELCKSFCKSNKLKMPVSELRKRIAVFHPDIRKLLNNLCSPSTGNDFRDINYVIFHKLLHNNYTSFDSKLSAASSDIFSLVPMAHENYIKWGTSDAIPKASESLAMCDAIHTHMFTNQLWDLIDTVSCLGVIHPSVIISANKAKLADIKYGSVLSKMSNLQTKLKTIKTIKNVCNATTNEQLVATKLLLSKGCDLGFTLSKSCNSSLQKLYCY